MYSYAPCLDKRLDERLSNSHLYINAVTRRYQDSKNTLWVQSGDHQVFRYYNTKTNSCFELGLKHGLQSLFLP
jgi:hypothetical protein